MIDRWIIAVGVLLVVVICFFGFLKRVPVGYVGLKVYNFATEQKGQIEQLGVGRHFILPFRDLYAFPTFSQNYNWSGQNAISFQSKDGLTLSTDVMIRYYFENSKIAELFTRFRLGADEIRDTIVRNTLRDKLNRVSVNYNAEEAFSTKKNELLDRSFQLVKEELSGFGVVIESIGFIGQIQLPDKVMNAINDKIEAKQVAEKQRSQIDTQRALTEAEVARQEGLAKAKIIEATSDAKANKLREQSLTPRVLELKRLEIEGEKIKKWDGKLPTYTGSATPFISLNK